MFDHRYIQIGVVQATLRLVVGCVCVASVILFLALDVQAQQGTVLVIQPEDGKDTWIEAGNQFSNFGGFGVMLNSNYFGIARSLIAFDVSGVPAGSVVTSAYMELLVHSHLGVGAGNGTMPISAYRILEPWDELTVNWGNQPQHHSVPEWTTGVRHHWTSWEITDLVQNWIDGTVDNNGILLKNDPELTEARSRLPKEELTANERKVWSRRGFIGSEIYNGSPILSAPFYSDPTFNPRLIVTYTMP